MRRSTAPELIYQPPFGLAVDQAPINGWHISYNPDDDRFYICYLSSYGDLETRATFANNAKGIANMRHYARHHTPPRE